MNAIILAFGLDPQKFLIQRIGSGYINDTFRLTGPSSYILQRVNKNIFTRPEIIANNIRMAANYLKEKHPEYLFPSPQPTVNGAEMSYDTEGYPWRLFRHIDNTMTIDKVDSPKEAFGAAAEFARLTHNLEGVEIDLFKPTIARFHDLPWRHEQFREASQRARPDRLRDALSEMELCQRYTYLVNQYTELIQKGVLQVRIMHNDTKINNILLDASTREAIAVIDLDTLMPGYFIYDAGDMIRTFVPPVNEEEKNLDKIKFREPIYNALVEGYLSHMGPALTATEKTLFPFAGMMMTYIMALRILTDFLLGDVYYQTSYPQQNLVRARNQLRLLEVLSDAIGAKSA